MLKRRKIEKASIRIAQSPGFCVGTIFQVSSYQTSSQAGLSSFQGLREEDSIEYSR